MKCFLKCHIQFEIIAISVKAIKNITRRFHEVRFLHYFLKINGAIVYIYSFLLYIIEFCLLFDKPRNYEINYLFKARRLVWCFRLGVDQYDVEITLTSQCIMLQFYGCETLTWELWWWILIRIKTVLPSTHRLCSP